MSKKAKLSCTMYFDYWSGDWDWVKPDGKLGDDYLLLRKGSVFSVYSTPEEIKQISTKLEITEPHSVICADKKGNWFGYQDRIDFEKSRIWEMKEMKTARCPICGTICECDECGSFECPICDYYDEGDWV